MSTTYAPRERGAMTPVHDQERVPCCGNCYYWEGDEATDRAGCHLKRDIPWRNEWCPSHEPMSEVGVSQINGFR